MDSVKTHWTNWRIPVQDRLARLTEAMERVPEASRGTPDYSIADACLKEASRASGLCKDPASKKGKCRTTIGFSWFTGALIEQTWSALHRAEEALLMLQADEVIRQQAIGMRAAVAHWPSTDTRMATYQGKLDAIIAGTGGLTTEQRETLRAIRETVDTRSDAAHAHERSLRNILLGLAAVLLLVVLSLGISQGTGSSVFSTCSVAATSSPPCRSVGEIELAAGLGGLISVIVFIRGLQTSSGPYNLAVAQAFLKIVAGAAIGLFGVLLVQHGVFDVLAPQDNNRVLGYAVLFGFAQQLVTQAVDRRAADFVAQTPGTRTASTGTKAPAS